MSDVLTITYVHGCDPSKCSRVGQQVSMRPTCVDGVALVVRPECIDGGAQLVEIAREAS